MGLTRTFKGFDEEAFKMGFKKSVGWKETSDNVDGGDLKEVVCSDIPSYSDESEQVEIKKIGVTKRNPLKFIGAGKGKLIFKQLLNSNYFNVYIDLIQATLGKAVLKVDGAGKFEEASQATIPDRYHIHPFGSTDFDNIFDSANQVQLIAILDSTGKVLDMDTIVSKNAITGDLTVAGALNESLDIGGSTEYTIRTLAWIDLDNVPDSLTDFLIQRDSGFNFANDPEFDGIYDGAETLIMKNALGTAKFELPLSQQGNIEYEFMTDDYMLVDPTPELLPATITVANVISAVAGSITLKRKGNSDINVSFTDGGTTDNNGTAGDIASVINALADYSATATGAVVTVTALGDYKYTYIEIGADKGEYAIAYNEADRWKETNESMNIMPPLVQFDSDATGSTLESKTVTINGVVFSRGNVAKLNVNGNVYERVIIDGDSVNDIAQDLAQLIQHDFYTLDGTDLREIRYNATFLANVLTITATDVSENLEVSFSIVDPSGLTDIHADIADVADTTALEYDDDDSVFFKLSKIKIGDAGSDMMDFCEVASLTLNFTRDLKDIKSICSATGRKGWNNTSYTLYFEVETTDIDAQRVFDKFDKYKNNKTFALQGVDVDSGFGFFFPACRFETFEKAPQDNLQGHKMTINVNFDPNKKPLLALHQIV